MSYADIARSNGAQLGSNMNKQSKRESESMQDLRFGNKFLATAILDISAKIENIF